MLGVALAPMHNVDEADGFQQLQAQLSTYWLAADLFDRQPRDIVIIPSLSLDQQELMKVKGINHYEERLLFALIRLRNPNTRLIYITSTPLDSTIVEYYLKLLPDVPFSDARSRLILLSTHDASARSLTQKVLERPRLLDRIRQQLRPNGTAYMTCFNSTQWEKDLAMALGIPLLGLDPDLLHWGTKCGSRQIFAEADVPHPDGCDEVRNAEDLATQAAELWERQPQLQRMVVKLNEGFSGQGNALLYLQSLQTVAPGTANHATRVEAIGRQLHHLSFQSDTESWQHYSRRIPDLGAIVEAFVEGKEKRSPSVQGRITPEGKVEILSTHDQILGGPDGQIFLGCSFPADEAYRLALQDYGLAVGEALAKKGALERFSVDFLAVKQADGSWDLQAIEINLRKGGTTHPFMTLKLLTGGSYDMETGLFLNQRGEPKYYMATDNLQNDRYKGLLPEDLMHIIVQRQLHFSPSREIGSVFHLIGCLSEFGKLGVLSVGDSPEHASEMYNQVKEALNEETENHVRYRFHPASKQSH